MKYIEIETSVKEIDSYFTLSRDRSGLYIGYCDDWEQDSVKLMSISTEYTHSLSTMWDHFDRYCIEKDEILVLAMELANTPLDERGDINEIEVVETW